MKQNKGAAVTVKIEKAIPIPEHIAGAPSKYPFLALEVGDSFFISGDKYRLISAARSNAQYRSGRKFSVRKVDGGTRVWRTA